MVWAGCIEKFGEAKTKVWARDLIRKLLCNRMGIKSADSHFKRKTNANKIHLLDPLEKLVYRSFFIVMLLLLVFQKTNTFAFFFSSHLNNSLINNVLLFLVTFWFLPIIDLVNVNAVNCENGMKARTVQDIHLYIGSQFVH